ncbi:ABC transporter ATP-binding protein [Rhodospira trueperi]|uniref:Multiple sugar transport system ATP-binding protein n=1 Tax=Rhodospira trueperi TaxID=69960 RepID=A0A1G7AR99_9PROT|nr:ABC transporter ATP-binding protein [Rhodospira trueperi]SDE16525.1 multiple sugar transport system ATP-binding protein [Rhodospira trueperi]
MELRNVRRSFGGTEVLRGISLDVPDGSFTSLLGPSGCGKSTTLRIMAGLDRPDSGQVLMNGEEVSDRSATARNIAMVFQSYALYPHLTVAQNMALPLTMRELSRWQRLPLVGGLHGGTRQTRRAIQARVAAMAAMLDLTDLLGRKPGQLSGGQQQRVAVGRALIREPSVFLLDEPLSNLDAKLRTQMRAELSALHTRTGRSFVYVTHDQTEAISMSDQVALMLEGRIAQIGPPRTLYETPQSRAVAAFIGDHPINLVPVSLAPGQASGAFARCRPIGLTTPRTVVIGLRPEHLYLDPAGPLEGRLVGAEYLGAETVLTLKVAEDVEIRAVAPGDVTPPAPDSPLRLGFAPEHVHVFDADGGERLDLSLERAAA